MPSSASSAPFSRASVSAASATVADVTSMGSTTYMHTYKIPALTTIFTPPSSCFVPTFTTSWDTDGLHTAPGFELPTEAACAPSPTDADGGLAIYFSPGVCPQNWYPASVSIWDPKTETPYKDKYGTNIRTDAVCCPSGYVHTTTQVRTYTTTYKDDTSVYTETNYLGSCLSKTTVTTPLPKQTDYSESSESPAPTGPQVLDVFGQELYVGWRDNDTEVDSIMSKQISQASATASASGDKTKSGSSPSQSGNATNSDGAGKKSGGVEMGRNRFEMAIGSTFVVAVFLAGLFL